MNVLVINASANKERSTTLKLTNAFLDGLGIGATEVEYETTIGLHINPLELAMLVGLKRQANVFKRTMPPR
jgi:FMN-dependent NADH-azoreductase